MTTQQPSQELLKSLLTYDPITGVFYWVKARQGVVVGQPAGCLKKGYVAIKINRTPYYAHRLAFIYMTGVAPAEVDHINGNPADNRWINLRAVTRAENQHNRKQANMTNKCGLLGAHRFRNKWRAMITVDGKTKHLGCYDTPEEASAAYLKAKDQFHPTHPHSH